MATYDLSAALEQAGDGYVGFSPFWILCVVRFKRLLFYGRMQQDSLGRLGASVDTDGSTIAQEREALILTDACTSLVTRASKSSHVKSLVARLKPDRNYLAEVIPGDWALCWMVRSEEKGKELLGRISSNSPCNKFGDGLKFVGRVNSIRKSLVQSPDGAREIGYDLQAIGFSEFDTSVFWDPYLSEAQSSILTWLGKLGSSVHDFFESGEVDVNKAIPTLVSILFGTGIGKATNPAGEAQLQAGAGPIGSQVGDDSAPYAYVVPATVGSLLGAAPGKPAAVLSYSDLLTQLYGIQKYEQVPANPADPAALWPSSTHDMLGKFLPAQPQFSGKTVWAILGQFLNPAVNEMYTALKPALNGSVYPTLVVRQLPFTTELRAQGAAGRDAQNQATFDAIVANAGSPPSDQSLLPDLPETGYTRFLELPRWKVPASAVQAIDVGRSDALRFNFVHMMGQATAQIEPNSFTAQLVRNPPYRDDQDIRRSGLRADMTTVACSIEDAEVGPAAWMAIRADQLMGQHLALTGSATCAGIEEPIAEGDNFEWDSAVFHVESVTHTCMIAKGGKKRFMTSLELSNGLASDPSQEPSTGLNADESLFTGLTGESFTEEDPGLSLDTSIDARAITAP